jgi:hydroxymethylbilane synthase
MSALVSPCFSADFSPARPVRIGTRGSPLARQQTQLVVSALSAAWPRFCWSQEVIATSGDKVTDRHLDEVGGKGLFAKEIDAALLAGWLDVAVHSLKDLETELPAGIVLACTLPRADPRDALVIDPRYLFDERQTAFPVLPAGGRIGTASARRQAQLLHARPDLRIGLIRGNVQSRLNRLEDGDFADTPRRGRPGTIGSDISNRLIRGNAPHPSFPLWTRHCRSRTGNHGPRGWAGNHRRYGTRG